VTTSAVVLVLAVFAASAVESVEAFTIVLASGLSRGWRSAMEGTVVALIVLAVIVGVVGVPLVKLVPIDALRVVIGALLLVLGLGWLRKAILRASGHKSLHDEDAIFARTMSELSQGDTGTPVAGGAAPGDRPPVGGHRGRDAQGFTVAFKGVFLEGMEVVLIVLTLGGTSHRLGLAAVAAAAAVVVVTAVGVIVARQLSQVPENALKLGVGVMLTSFGVFWVGEGAGIHWPGADLWLLTLVALFSVVALVSIRVMRRALLEGRPAVAKAPAHGGGVARVAGSVPGRVAGEKSSGS
jgi:uncharacterized membrane protein